MLTKTAIFLLFLGLFFGLLLVFSQKLFYPPNRVDTSYKYLQSELTKCKASKNQKCYENLAANIAKKEDITKTLVLLKEHVSDNVISQSCHLFTHDYKI